MFLRLNSKAGLFLLICAAICFFAVPTETVAQEKIEKEVKAASFLLIKDYQKGLAEFHRIGPDAIPYIVKIISNESTQTSFQKIRINPLLVNVIAQFQTPEVEDVLIELLAHQAPRIRVAAAFFLGERKSQKSIPALAKLLDDESVYATEYSSDGSQKKILVRDHIVLALEKITGVKQPSEKDCRTKLEAGLKQQETKNHDIKA